MATALARLGRFSFVHRRAVLAQTIGARWVALATRRPWTALLGGVVLLGVLAIPALDLRLGLPSAATAPPDSTQRKAYDLIAARIGPEVNGPLTLVVDTASSGAFAAAAGAALESALRGVPDVAAITPPRPVPGDTLAIVSVIPVSGPDSPETTALVNRIRALAPGGRPGERRCP